MSGPGEGVVNWHVFYAAALSYTTNDGTWVGLDVYDSSKSTYAGEFDGDSDMAACLAAAETRDIELALWWATPAAEPTKYKIFTRITHERKAALVQPGGQSVLLLREEKAK